MLVHGLVSGMVVTGMLVGWVFFNALSGRTIQLYGVVRVPFERAVVKDVTVVSLDWCLYIDI